MQEPRQNTRDSIAQEPSQETVSQQRDLLHETQNSRPVNLRTANPSTIPQEFSCLLNIHKSDWQIAPNLPSEAMAQLLEVLLKAVHAAEIVGFEFLACKFHYAEFPPIEKFYAEFVDSAVQRVPDALRRLFNEIDNTITVDIERSYATFSLSSTPNSGILTAPSVQTNYVNNDTPSTSDKESESSVNDGLGANWKQSTEETAQGKNSADSVSSLYNQSATPKASSVASSSGEEIDGRRSDAATLAAAERRILELEKNEALLQQKLSVLSDEVKALREQQSGHVVSLSTEVKEVRKQVETLTKSNRNSVTLLEGLTPLQRNVLEAIQKLPVDAFKEAEKLLNTIEGQPLSEAFSKSFAAVLRKQKGSVLCGSCGASAAVYWHADTRYAENGRAFFSHSNAEKNGAKIQHGSLTSIPRFKLVQRLDRRLNAR